MYFSDDDYVLRQFVLFMEKLLKLGTNGFLLQQLSQQLRFDFQFAYLER